ncbi:hypothetical protein LCGC14_1449120 [marine sediment metagenome]|uniref:Uncharacterized protein n=1 Tax=marine sediment metagenome TaxID=412755 RepID=A0A0F9JI97_9ZZZZ
MTKTVRPIDFHGWNMSLAQLVGLGPKFAITCGSCRRTFKKRIPMVDAPGIECPSCRAINVLPITITTGED